MHHIRSDARRAGWADPRNPFGRNKPPSKRSSASRAEAGENPLRNVTSVPQGFTPGSHRERGDGLTTDLPPHSSTAPNARFRSRGPEPGDDVEIPSATSPPESIRDFPMDEEKKVRYNTGSDGTERTYTNGAASTSPEKAGDGGGGVDKQHGHNFLRSMLGGKAADRKDDLEAKEHDDDNNNGKEKKHFTAMGQIRATLFNSWINVLLICSPMGIALYYAKVDPIAIFVVNFIAIIPLAAMLSYATEEIALRVGEVLGGLLNASFGNAVELIVSIIALAHDQVLIVQTSLIGSMLSNLLLVLGMCFFFGGFNRIEQAFNMTVAQTAASLLFLAVSSLIIPTAFEEWANTGSTDQTTASAVPVPGVAALSRATAILLLLVYACYLFFQLKTHASMYNAPSEKNEKRDFSGKKQKWKARIVPSKLRKRPTEVDAAASDQQEDVDEPEEPQLSITVAILTLLISTVFVALNAEYLVDSINDITCGGGISKNFVGLILLPIVGNAAEHATAVTVAIKDKMDLAIGVAVGSSMQIALLVLPLVVVLGWIIGKDDMTLYFDGFQIAVLFVAVLLVNYLIQDGKSHWLEGVLLITLYIIIAVAAWFYPTAPGLSDCPA